MILSARLLNMKKRNIKLFDPKIDFNEKRNIKLVFDSLQH